MDSRRFDALTRAFAAGGTRRRILAALAALPLGGLLASLDADDISAERPRDRLKRRNKQHHRKRRNQQRRKRKNNTGNNGNKGGANPGNCTPNGNACNQNSDCCQGNCFGQVCANTFTQCGSSICSSGATGCCPNDGCCGSPANQCNSAGLCCAPNCGNRECGNDGCGNSGVCGQCKNGQSCNSSGQCTGQPACNAQTCPNGCCDANGACQQGNTAQSCGTDGASCTECLPGQTCSAARTCEGTPICNAEVCPLGCCDANNICRPGRNASFCGSNGEACVTCLPEEFCSLVSRHCEEEFACSENTCNGCCDSAGNCQPGTEKVACGTGGITCRNCSGSAAICDDGICECTPSCQGKTCGDDGCGGSCGACPINQFCDEQNNPTNWQCADKCTPDNCENGCCDATGTCQPGNINAACGTSGRPCKTCDPHCQVCVERTSDDNGVGLDWICAQRCGCGPCGCNAECNGPATCDERLQTCCTPAMEFVPCPDDGPCCPPAVCGVTRSGLGCCYPIGVVNPQRDVRTCCGSRSAMDPETGVCCHPGIDGGCV